MLENCSEWIDWIEFKMNDVTFLTMMIPNSLQQEVAQKSSHNMQDAADAIEKHIYEGLCENLQKEPHVVNVLPIDSFPQYYKDAYVNESLFVLGRRLDHVNLGFCNIKLIRNVFIEQSIYKNLLTYYKMKKASGKKVLIVYSATANFLRAVKRVKRVFPDIIICNIIADLPILTNLSNNKSSLLKTFIKRSSKKAEEAMCCVDCFVLLTKQMADYLKIDKPYCIMEGISSPATTGSKYQNETKKVILYSGTLHEKFGILNLIKAFQQITNPDYELVICGVGDSEKEIRRAATEDKRIHFLGKIPRDQVLKWQSEVTVLVNPRQNNEEYTKYSFPSKTMEYLASGTPVVAYKLDGIPDEYDQYINYVEDNSTESLAKKLVEICELSVEERSTIGQRGRSFVLREKNSRIQTKKIIDLIESM